MDIIYEKKNKIYLHNPEIRNKYENININDNKLITGFFNDDKLKYKDYVITKDLPPYTICCGVPCKPVKKRYSEDVVNFLLELKWWNWSNEKIKNNEKFFYLNLNNYNINEIIKIIN